MQEKQGDHQDSLSDEALVLLAQSGDTEAFVMLSSRYESFFNIKIRSFPESHLHEDFRSEAMLAFFTAVRTFDPSRASFRTYLNLCVTRALISFQRKLRADDHNHISLDDFEDAAFLNDADADPQVLLEARERTDLRIAEMKKKLSRFELDAFSSFLRGRSYEQIAKELHTTEKSVDNALQRVRLKLKKSDLFR